MAIDFYKEEESSKLRGSLQEFTKFFTKYIKDLDYIESNPVGRESHQITICRELSSFTRMEHPDENLLINVQPGSGKTLQICMWVAWCYAINPKCNFIYISHSQTLAAEQTAFIRMIMSSQMYSYLFDVHISKETKAKDHFATTENGHIAAFGAAGAITGRNAGLPGLDYFSGAVIIDDAHKPDEAFSDKMRESVIRNYEVTIRQRPRGSNVPIIFIGQRVHESDLAAFFIDGKDIKPWRKVILKALDDAGNALFPEVHSKEYLLELEAKSPYVYYSQFQQEPTPAGGTLFQPDWFLELPNEPEMLMTFLTADTSETAKSHNDPTAMSFFGIYEIEAFGKKTGQLGLHWIDCLEDWIDAKDLEERFIDFWRECSRHKVPPFMAAIEKKSTGVTLIGTLQKMQGLKIRDVMRTAASGSKGSRYIEMQPYIASKRVTFTYGARHVEKCKKHMSKISANNAHRHDDICHLAGSKIATIYGYKNVEDIIIGDQVITPFGYGRVTACGSTGFHKVISKFGLTSTPDHKVFYNGKFIPLIKAIDVTRLSFFNFCELLKWKQRQLLFLMEKNLGLRHRQDISKAAKEYTRINFFTVLFGNFIQNKKYLKAISFIIKTTINLIIVSKIWTVFHISNIVRYTLKGNQLANTAKKLWKKCGKILGKRNQQNNINKHHPTDHVFHLIQKITQNVANAITSLNEKLIPKKLALSFAGDQCKENGINKETKTGHCLPLNADFVESHIKPSNTFQKNTIQKHAQEPAQEDMDMKEVYSLTVEQFGVYYCNDILVQNCDTLYDGIKIALIDKHLYKVPSNETTAADNVMNTIALQMRRQQTLRMNRDGLR
jgi:hypothetical protein